MENINSISENMVPYFCKIMFTKEEVPPRFELGSLDSKSRVLTVTPWDHAFVMAISSSVESM